MPFRVAALTLIASAAAVFGQTEPSLLDRTTREAEAFREKIRFAISRETLVQRSYMLPPHSHIAIGAAALPLRPRFILHEIVSEYSAAPLKGSGPPQLVEFRELLTNNGMPAKTPESARRALQQDVQAGDERIRRRILEEFTSLGLVDVATDYGLILLAFTREGLRDLEVTPGDEGFVGAEPARALLWRQTTGGAVEFRGRKVARRPLEGTLWIRRSDGLPLRISCRLEHPDGKHVLRDDATVDYAAGALGFLTPASVVHRHFVDGEALTENLYTYEPFRLFGAESTIQFTGAAGK
jgi:hypothetical protein